MDWTIILNGIQVVKVSLIFKVVENIRTSWGIEQNNRVSLKFMEEKNVANLIFLF